MTDANELVIKTLPTYTATIYLGLEQRHDGHVHSIQSVEEVCRAYCDFVGLCVTVTPTRFIYTNGNEPGASVGLIHYPRFPDGTDRVKQDAIRLAKLLKKKFGQRGVSIVLSDETIWIADPRLTLVHERQHQAQKSSPAYAHQTAPANIPNPAAATNPPI